MSDQTINIEITVGEFPEGEQMTPGRFAQWFAENITFTATGAFLNGVISAGGTSPNTDSGIYVADRLIRLWDTTKNKYRQLLTTPIGSMMVYPCGLLTPPEDYLFCDGTLVLKTDFPELYAVLGDTWKATGDDAAYFRLPNTMGRIPVGEGTGDYNPHKLSGVPTGFITQHTVGEYFGAEFTKYAQVPQTNAPTVKYYYPIAGNKPVAAGKPYTGVSNPSFVVKWIMRAK